MEIKICFKCENGWLHLSVFGKRIIIRDGNKYPLLFSERKGYTAYKKIGKWVITLGKIRPFDQAIGAGMISVNQARKENNKVLKEFMGDQWIEIEREGKDQ